MKSSAIKAERVEQFLLYRQWRLIKENDRLRYYRAPETLVSARDFTLSVPLEDESAESQAVFAQLVHSLSVLYDLSPEQLRTSLTFPGAVLSIRLEGRDTDGGAMPFTKFEGFIEKLRKSLLDTAAFVLTGLPNIKEISADAIRYVEQCQFLQTEYGSFVAKVQLPEEEPLNGAQLFPEHQIPSAEVGERLADVLALVLGPVFHQDERIYEDEFWTESRQLINVDVLSDISELLAKASAQEVTFTLTGSRIQKVIKSGTLTPIQYSRLARFIHHAKERIDDIVDVDLVGKIFSLRSRDPSRNRNYIAVQGMMEGRNVVVSVSLSSGDYETALQAHKEKKNVRIKGQAERLKTQYSIVRLDLLKVVDEDGFGIDS